MEYPLINIEGVFLFLNNDSYYLIDTGSPFTYTKFGSILINEKEYKNTLFKSILEDRCNKLSSRLKKNVCGIIGLDVIFSEGLFIDKKNNKLSFCSNVFEMNI